MTVSRELSRYKLDLVAMQEVSPNLQENENHGLGTGFCA
jgi:hypothetical protein